MPSQREGSDAANRQEPTGVAGPNPNRGWRRYMIEDPAEYSPEFQDEYQRLWHEAAAERDRLREFIDHTLTEYGERMSSQWKAHARSLLSGD